jgi:hypothetical protein
MMPSLNGRQQFLKDFLDGDLLDPLGQLFQGGWNRRDLRIPRIATHQLNIFVGMEIELHHELTRYQALHLQPGPQATLYQLSNGCFRIRFGWEPSNYLYPFQIDL